MPQLGQALAGTSSGSCVLPWSASPESRSERPKWLSTCAPFWLAHVSQRCSSVICSLTISVRCTVACDCLHSSHTIGITYPLVYQACLRWPSGSVAEWHSIIQLQITGPLCHQAT